MIRALFIILFLLLSTPSWSSDHMLMGLQNKAVKITSIASDFSQEKHLSLFDEVLISNGTFAFKRPSSLRWEYTSPFKNGFLLKGDSGIEWDEASNSERPFTLKSAPAMSMVATQIMAWTTFDIPWLKERYEIKQLKDNPLTLELRPRSEIAKEFLAHLIVMFSADSHTVSTIELQETDGDFTRIIFKNTQINTTIPDTTFTTVR